MIRVCQFMVLLTVCILIACTSRPSTSYVTPDLTTEDAQTLASDAVEHLAETLPAAHTTLVLDLPITKKQDALTQTLLSLLSSRGYGISIANSKTGVSVAKGTSLRYLASTFDSGVVLRLQYLGVEASCFYPRTTDGKLLSNIAPFTVRDNQQ